MKTIISDDGGYVTTVEVTDIACLKGHKHLKFTTTYSQAKDPLEEHTKMTLILSPEAYAQLVKAIN
jgi:hypothetical protein